jgi:hypothetical protein
MVKSKGIVTREKTDLGQKVGASVQSQSCSIETKAARAAGETLELELTFD